MSFANLLKPTHEFEFGGVNLRIKKFSFGFTEWLTLHLSEKQSLVFSKGDDGRTRVVNSGTIIDYQIQAKQKMKESIVWWDLKDSEGQSVPLTDEVFDNLLTDHGDFCNGVLAIVDEFNGALQKKTKS